VIVNFITGLLLYHWRTSLSFNVRLFS